MLYKSNAKINLGLRILEKREDGYHNLESVFLPIPWYDDLEINKSNKFNLEIIGNKIAGNIEENLCYKAYQLMRLKYHIEPISISLTKRIPSGAGMGGGSSNAAFVLMAINDLYELGLNDFQLMDLADSLGSDCSFFIKNKPSLVEGKGEKVEPIKFDFNDYIVVVNPALHISTQEAFASIEPKKADTSILELLKTDKKTWQSTIINDFEEVMLNKHPSLIELKKSLLDSGAYYVSLSGSGSTFFALFEEDPKDKLKVNTSFDKRIFKLDL